MRMGEGTGPFKCPKCKTTTYSDHDNCPNCGEALTIRCSECGHHWRFIYNYNYCPQCGTKVKK